MAASTQNKADERNQVSTLIEYHTLPGSTAVVYSTIASTVVSVQPGRTIHETSVTTEVPVGPVSQPSTIYLTQTLPGKTYTSFLTAPGYNHSIVYTSFVTRPGPTVVDTAPGALTTVTEFQIKSLPGGSVVYTQFATKTLPGAVTTSIIYQPGENSTITSTETTTCYETETISTCSASPTAPVSPPHEITVYATNYITETAKPTTYTAEATCSDKTITITASSSGWDKPSEYGPHSTSESWDKPSDYGSHSTSDDWDHKPSSYGGAASTHGGSWK